MIIVVMTIVIIASRHTFQGVPMRHVKWQVMTQPSCTSVTISIFRCAGAWSLDFSERNFCLLENSLQPHDLVLRDCEIYLRTSAASLNSSILPLRLVDLDLRFSYR